MPSDTTSPRSSESAAPSATDREGEASRRGPLRPAATGTSRTVAAAALCVVAIAFLQGILASFYWLPGLSARAAVGPVWDVVGVVLLLVAWAVYVPRRRWAERTLLIVLTTVLFLFFLLGIGQGFAKREFGYDLILRLHIVYVPDLIRMLYEGEPLSHFILYLLLLASGIVLVIAGIYVSLRYLRHYVADRRRRQLGVAGGVVAYLVVGAVAVGAHGPLVKQAYRQAELALHLDSHLNLTARRMEMTAAKLRGDNPFVSAEHKPDIFLFVVESYGQALLDTHKYKGFADFLRLQQRQLAQAGYHTVSKYYRTPTFGGSSWMADSTLLCGVRISNQARFRSLLRSHVKCLPSYLNDAGYRTVGAAADCRSRGKAYRSRFPFNAYYVKDRLHYKGPRFAWSFMPDQYVIDYIDRHEVKPHWDEPLFMYYVLTSSHHPWTTIPRFIPWHAIGDGSVYHELAPVRFDNAFVTGDQYKAGFRASIQYSLTSITRYLERLPADRDVIAFVLGDHQVRRPIADMNRDPWWVPMHIISRNPDDLKRFVKLGYTPGMVPSQPHGKPDVSWHFLEELFAAYRGK